MRGVIFCCCHSVVEGRDLCICCAIWMDALTITAWPQMARTPTCIIAILLLLLTTGCCAEGGMDDVEMKYVPLEIDYAMKWGAWGDTEFCPEGTFAYGFRIKVEDSTAKDDTALNGITLMCRYPGDVGSEGIFPKKKAWEANITSTVQKWGRWKGRRTCYRGFLTAVRMRTERNRGIFMDDTAANDVEMECNWSPKGRLKGGGTYWGKWSSWEECPQGRIICGIQTRVEDHLPIYEDDTALNDVRMFCCELDPDYLYF